MARIRVVFSIGGLHGGGSERQLVSLLRNLDRTRFEPFLYLVYRTGPLLDLVPKDVPVVAFEERVRPSRFYLPGRMHRLRVSDYAAYLKEVGAHVSYDRTFLMTLISADGAQRVGVPNVSTIVTNPETGFAPVAGRFQWLKRRILHRLYNHSSRVLAVSDGARQAAIRFYGIAPEKIVVHANGVDVDLVNQLAAVPVSDPWWSSEQPFRIVTAGRLNEQKGFHFLIEAIQLLRARLPNKSIRLAILGDGPWKEELQSRIRAAGLESSIHLAGFQSNAAAWYRSADLFVLPSLVEGSPNVLLEAIVCGTPVISSDCPSGPAEILRGGQLGRLVPPGNSEALAEAIGESIARYPMWLATAKAAEQMVITENSIRSSARKLEAIFEEVALQA
ncbi:MAG: glycosyltransferase [Planctomyces sp.]|nr:glycosyltransferase [Planctomyces sp.]